MNTFFWWVVSAVRILLVVFSLYMLFCVGLRMGKMDDYTILSLDGVLVSEVNFSSGREY